MDHLHRNFFAQVDSPPRVQIDGRKDCFCSSGFGFQALASLASILLAICGVAGCSTNHASAQSPQTPLISIALAQLPPAILPVSTSAQVSATVSNDPANAGVDWMATCGSATADCGRFSSPHTDSGAATTFWAPSAVPPHKAIVVTALSATDHSKASAFSVTIVSNVTSITITKLPPATAPAGSTIPLSATVVGDPANLGVDWTANCGGINCTPNNFHSASGGTVNFVIPSQFQLPNIVGSTVTITAYATADHSFSAVATFVVGNPILVNITQLPPSTMLTNATATLIAVVQNDPTNSGVNWSVSCSTPPCGTLNPLQTASGAPAVFTAPPVLPANATSMGVTIVAQALADPSATFSANVTIVLPISVQITQGVTNGTIQQGHNASLVATVTNDPASAGVDWSVTCSGLASCGTFTPTHTASGSPTTYTAPATAASVSVTITATSTADSTKTATQSVTVTPGVPPNSLLNGTFVMLLSSENSQNNAYVVGGVISGKANLPPDTNGGTITDATFDLVDASTNSGSSIHILSSPPSTYSIGPDGRGQIKLLIDIVTLNRNFGVTGSASPCGTTANCGSLTLSVVFVSPQHAILSESDSFGTASGTLDLQNLQGFSGLSPGVYSLSLSGSEIARPTAGYFVASAVTIPSTTGYSYITDQSDDGVITSVPFTTSSQAFITAAFINGNSSGNLINLGLPTKHLNFWAIDATHFVVTDLLDSLATATPQVVVSGHLTLQPSSPAISGTYAFTEAGATTAAQPQVAGGIFTCGSTGTLDAVPLTGAGTPLINQPVTNVTCGAVTNGRSLIAMTGAASSGINQFAAYPTTDQGLYLIELDGGTSGTSGSSGAGVALQQTLSPPIASTALNGKYASNFSASTAAGSSQAFAAQIAADGVSKLAGAGDVNSYNATAAIPVATPSLGAGFSGTYSPANDGRFPFTLTITPASGQPTPPITNLNLACYLVDAKTCMLLALDATAPGTGMLLLQNTGL